MWLQALPFALSLLLPWDLHSLLIDWRTKSLHNTCFVYFYCHVGRATLFLYGFSHCLLTTSRDQSREDSLCSTYMKQGSIGWGFNSTRWPGDHCVVVNGSSRIPQKYDSSSNSILIPPSPYCCGSRVIAVLRSIDGCTVFRCLRLSSLQLLYGFQKYSALLAQG